MLAKRIIPCLDVRDGKVVKGSRFRDHVVLGDILDFALRYRDAGADELVFYDITASSEKRTVTPYWIEAISRILDIPFCVAGGIRSVEDARRILSSGADKISINTPAIENPDLIQSLAEEFGSQCIVVGIDSRRDQNHILRIWKNTGKESTAEALAKPTMEWIQEVQDRGAGEIVLNCIDADGTRHGYDLEQLKTARALTKVPLVASGGAGSLEDFQAVFQQAGVDAALAAGVFHRGEIAVADLKLFLHEQGITVRL